MGSPRSGSPRCLGWAGLNMKKSRSSDKFGSVSPAVCPHPMGETDIISLGILIIAVAWRHDSFSEIQETNE